MNDPTIEVVTPDEPDLAVKLKAAPPPKGTTYSGSVIRGEWTLDLLERTLLEFRVAGGWDGSRIEFERFPAAAVVCEVLARRGEDAMPWGWRPSVAPAPKRQRWRDRRVVDAVPAALGNRALHGVLLLTLVVLAVVFR